MGSKLKNYDSQRDAKRENIKKKYLEDVPEKSGVQEEEGVLKVALDEDELHRQMKAVKAGKKDLHDLVIERAEKQLLDRLREDYTRVSELRISKGEPEIALDSDSKPISQEEMKKRIKERREEIVKSRQTASHAEEYDINKSVQMSQLSEQDRKELTELANRGSYRPKLSEEERIKQQHEQAIPDNIKFSSPNRVSNVSLQELISQLDEEPKHKGSTGQGGKDGD